MLVKGDYMNMKGLGLDGGGGHASKLQLSRFIIFRVVSREWRHRSLYI